MSHGCHDGIFGAQRVSISGFIACRLVVEVFMLGVDWLHNSSTDGHRPVQALMISVHEGGGCISRRLKEAFSGLMAAIRRPTAQLSVPVVRGARRAFI